ncbi:MAG: NUDIX domain-containing protein [Terriglobales bacterium]
MAREISAGGVVVRDIDGVWHVALIEPQKEDSRETDSSSRGSEPAKAPRKRSRAVLCLPKGLVDAGEKAEAAAVREVFEETGIAAEAITKLVDIKYVYVRSWGDGQRVFKIVSFYLMKYVSGDIGDISPEMRIEVERALWIPLEDAGKQMAYSGERKVVLQARDYLAEHGLTATKSPVGRKKATS